MSSLTMALISAGCIFSGVLLGMVLRRLLPGHHLSNDSKDTVKLAAGMIATLSALVLGLRVSSAKSSFDTVGSEVTQGAARIILLLCALSVSGAVFLIYEMNHPLSGFIKVSGAPMLKALEHLGQ